MTTELIISIISTLGGLFSAIFGVFYLEKKKKQTLLATEIEIDNIRNKLKYFYYPIHFKLLRLQYAKYHIKYLKNIFDNTEIIKIEEDIILNIHKEIIEIITNNNYLNDIDENMDQALIKYINHATLYINLRKFNIYKMPSQYGFDFPAEFSTLIENNTIELKKMYDTFMGLNKNTNKIKKHLLNDTIIDMSRYNKHNNIIEILNNPESKFHKNLTDDINISNSKKILFDSILNDPNITTKGIQNLTTIFNNISSNDINEYFPV